MSTGQTASSNFDDDYIGRSKRLREDYLGPERVMRELGIEQTIVVFGGTRVPDSREAKRLGKPDYYGIAREFGAIVGRSGSGPTDCRLTLMTGAGPGIMEAANRGAADVGAKSIGLNIALPVAQHPNRYVSPELLFEFRYFAIRKLHFMLRAKALVAFPGGYGTVDELFETLNLTQNRKVEPLPVILVSEKFWRGFFRPEFLLEQGTIDREDLDLFSFAETAEQAWSRIIEFHRRHGSPLLCDSAA
jgi:uncharacterized protein (TIGR00730 family)